MNDYLLNIPPAVRPVAARLVAAGANLARLTPGLRVAGGRRRYVKRALLQNESERLRRPRYLCSGWAYRYTQFADGRRQIYDFVLPGEGVGICLQPRPFASTSVAALTRVELVDAEPFLPHNLSRDPELVCALERISDADEGRLLEQIARLGRMSAVERLTHLLLQLHDRLLVIEAVKANEFRMPVTQELLGDLLGLSTVHVNRTVQELRRQDLAIIERGSVVLLDRVSMQRLLPTAMVSMIGAVA